MTSRQSIFTVAVALVSAAFGSTARAEEAPSFTVASVRTEGTGCPSGSVRTQTHADGISQELEIIFRAFEGAGSTPVSDQASSDVKACSLAVALQPQQGYQLALANIETRGLADVLGVPYREPNTRVTNVLRYDRRFLFGTPGGAGFDFPSKSTYFAASLGFFVIAEETTAPISYADCNARVVAEADLRATVIGEYNSYSLSTVAHRSGLSFKLLARACQGNEPKAAPRLVPVAGDDRTTVKNACVIAGVGTKARKRICYDVEGAVISTTPVS
jgi:hypothetical protein